MRKKKYKILCLSANYPHKNLKIIPEIIKYFIKKGFHNFKFIISLDKDELKFDDKYDKYIDYLGKIDLRKLPNLYNNIDVVFMPTLLEVFSATYLEAMFMKKPIVTTDLSFAHDICSDSALYFNPINPKDAAEKLLLIYKDNSLYSELVNKGSVNIKRFGTSMDRTNKYLKILLK